MVSNLTRNQAPACRLRVRAPCPPLCFGEVIKLDELLSAVWRLEAFLFSCTGAPDSLSLTLYPDSGDQKFTEEGSIVYVLEFSRERDAFEL